MLHHHHSCSHIQSETAPSSWDVEVRRQEVFFPRDPADTLGFTTFSTALDRNPLLDMVGVSLSEFGNSRGLDQPF